METTKTIDTLSAQKSQYIEPPDFLKNNTLIQDYDSLYLYSITQPKSFWGSIAKELFWYKKWDKVFDFNMPYHKWFINRKTNITVNALDRHVKGENRSNRNKVALIWMSETGEEVLVTYDRLLRRVNQVANALKSLGVKKGDRVIIYMPLTLQGIYTMLACARIGAIHSVVYAGMGVQALRSRIEDSKAKVVVCADVTYRNGKVEPLKVL